MPLVELNGTTIFYHDAGIGPALFALHGGLGFDHSYMLRALSGLTDSCRIVAPDHRGNGRSGRPPEDTFSMAQFARDLEALRIHLRVEKLGVVGHSYGGFIALQYALDFPDAISHLVLVDTEADSGDADRVLESARTRSQAPEVMAALLCEEQSDEEFALNVAVTQPLYFHDPVLAGHALHGAVFSQYGNARGAELLSDYDVKRRLGELRMPTLIVCGRDDFVTPVAQSIRIAAGIAGSQIVVFEKSGHFPMFEEPLRFTRTLREFLLRR